MESVSLDNYGLHVINFEHVFTKAYSDIVEDLYTYDRYHDLNVRTQDTKKIYYYHMIKTLCDTIIETKTINKIVIYFSIKDIKCDFKQNMNKRTRNMQKDTRSDFILFMSRFFKQIKTIIPVKVYIGDVKFNTFIQYYNTNKGKYLEMVNTMRSTKNTPNFNFNKFKTFTEKYKLTYLTDQYLKQVKVKSIMYK